MAVKSVPGVALAAGLRDRFPDIETDDALRFVTELYTACRDPLDKVLKQRVLDRLFIDRTTAACSRANKLHSIPFASPEYRTAMGERDGAGRTVVGLHAPGEAEVGGHVGGDAAKMVTVPDFMKGAQVR